MKVLITGASGLVGRALQDRLKESHDYIVYTASSSECNLENYEETLNYFRQVLPTYVIHLAAHVGGLYKNLEYIAYCSLVKYKELNFKIELFI